MEKRKRRLRASCDTEWKPLLFERGGGTRGTASKEVGTGKVKSVQIGNVREELHENGSKPVRKGMN